MRRIALARTGACRAPPLRRPVVPRRRVHVVDRVATPPFAVRCGLVGTVTAAATPLFPVVGAYRLVSHFVPNKGARLLLLGGAGGIFSYAVRDALPLLVDHAELVAPFAAANGLVAAAAYGALEKAAGGPRPLLDRCGRLLPRSAPPA